MKKNSKSLFLLVPFLFGALSAPKSTATQKASTPSSVQVDEKSQKILFQLEREVDLLDQEKANKVGKSKIKFTFSKTIQKQVNTMLSSPKSDLSSINARLARDGKTEILPQRY